MQGSEPLPRVPVLRGGLTGPLHLQGGQVPYLPVIKGPVYEPHIQYTHPFPLSSGFAGVSSYVEKANMQSGSCKGSRV